MKSNYNVSSSGKQVYDYYVANLAYPIKDANEDILDYRYYEARLVVRKENNNNFAYDLDKFIEKKGAVLDKTSLSIVADKSADGSLMSNNIPQSNASVKSDISTKYSMQEKDNDTQELEIKQKSFEELSEIEKEKLNIINKEIYTERGKIYSTKPETTDIEKEQAKKKVIELKQRKLDIYNGNLKVDKAVPLTNKSAFEVSFDENELNKDNTLDE
ncbi:MAG: hypothetical protein RR923_06650 [Bacilli bacterium]